MIRTLREGMTGEDVRTIQKALNARNPHGPRLDPDGVFWTKTRDAVVALQRLTGCDDDGVVGKQTRSVLFPLVTATTTITPMRLRMPRLFGSGAPSSQQRPHGAVPARVGASPVMSGSELPSLLPPLTITPPSLNPLDWFLNPISVPRLPGAALPAPRVGLLGFQFDSFQAQTGGSFNLPPLDPSGSSTIVLQSVWSRKREDSEEQLQFTLGTQIQGPLTIPSDDGSNWTVSAFTQFTWADPFWHFGRFHLVQPFAQITGQFDLAHRSPSVSLGLFPINISVDLVGDGDVAINAQGGLVGTLQQQSRNDGSSVWQATCGPSVGLGLTFKIPQSLAF